MSNEPGESVVSAEAEKLVEEWRIQIVDEWRRLGYPPASWPSAAPAGSLSFPRLDGLVSLISSALEAARRETAETLEEWTQHTHECNERSTDDYVRIQAARDAGQPDPCEIACRCGLWAALEAIRSRPTPKAPEGAPTPPNDEAMALWLCKKNHEHSIAACRVAAPEGDETGEACGCMSSKLGIPLTVCLMHRK